VEFTNSHAIHVNYHTSDRQAAISNTDTKNTSDTYNRMTHNQHTLHIS